MQPLTKAHQPPEMDILNAYHEAIYLRGVIKEKFNKIYQKSIELAASVDVVPAERRITMRKQHRANMPSTSVEEHYRNNLFYPFVDYIESQMEARFVERTEPAMLASYLFPKFTKEKEDKLIAW